MGTPPTRRTIYLRGLAILGVMALAFLCFLGSINGGGPVPILLGLVLAGLGLRMASHIDDEHPD